MNLYIADTANQRVREVTGGTFVSVSPDPWVYIGSGDFNADGTPDLLWWNRTTGLVAIWLMDPNSPGNTKSITFPAAPDPTIWKILGIGDFNGDGTADIVLQDQKLGDSAYGLVAMWLMDPSNPGRIKSTTFPKTLDPTTYKLLGIGDFDGNGTADLAWRYVKPGDPQNGLVAMWLMDKNHAGVINTIDFPGTADPSIWTLTAIADFDGNGTADLAWQDQKLGDSSFGLVAMWMMSSTTPGAVSAFAFPGGLNLTTWHWLGIGNFDASSTDATADLLWQDLNPTDSNDGLAGMWLMSPTSAGTYQVTFPGTAGSASWALLGIADLNGDGTADLIWQDVNPADSTYGLVGIWIIHNGVRQIAVFPGSPNPSQWQFVGLLSPYSTTHTDANLVWRNVLTGQVDDWVIANGNLSTVTSPGNA